MSKKIATTTILTIGSGVAASVLALGWSSASATGAVKGPYVQPVPPAGSVAPHVIAADPLTLPPPANARVIGSQADLGGVSLPFSPTAFTVTNMFTEVSGQTYVTVVAGAKATAPNVGVVRVIVADPAAGSTTVTDYTVPNGTGVASLTSLSGQNVNVSTASTSSGAGAQTAAASSSAGQFNVTSRSWG